MKYEWKKNEKHLYGIKQTPELVDVPSQKFIMIQGAGNPNKADFSDRISYIFGHNIWDKTKFYDLRKFEDKTFLENHKTFYVYTEKGKLEYEVLSVDLVDPDTPLYELSSKRNEDVDAMKKELSKHISKSEVDKIDKNTKLLMLVTCKTPDDNTARRILFAKLKEK